ncbi:hypothetical protein LJC60_06500, partial [Ruminococcaceae bacterium OttesenSCG-928-D13]|nr:hypothetical protein [Ruminococcaceae bacterium OttesenSCG-928-D13]
CGSIWKDWQGSFAFFERFRERARVAVPELEVRYPLYEPVVGGAVYAGYHMGYDKTAILTHLERGFAPYRLPAPDNI